MNIGQVANIYISESKYKMILTEMSKIIFPNLYAEVLMRVNNEKKSNLQIVGLQVLFQWQFLWRRGFAMSLSSIWNKWVITNQKFMYILVALEVSLTAPHCYAIMFYLASIVGSRFPREVVKLKQFHALCYIIYCWLGYDGTLPEFSLLYGSELELQQRF